MTDKERTAIALLKSGRSWKEAYDNTGIPIDQLRHLWESRKEAFPCLDRQPKADNASSP